MINTSVPNLSSKEKKNLSKCIDDNYISAGGIFLNKFSRDICKVTKSKFSILTSSGSSALHTSLMTTGVKRDDLIIVPSFTFIATVNAIKLTGAEPWFFDICEDDWSINVNLLEKELKNKTYIDKKKILRHKKTKQRIGGIVTVYSLGLISDIYSLKKISRKYNLPIIADGACAIGATSKLKKIGQLDSDITILSFNGNKTITSGGGGALIFNKKKYFNLAKIYSSNGRLSQKYLYNKIGYNYKMNNIQAAIGVAQLKKLNLFLKKKIFIRNFYNKKFKNLKKYLDYFPEKKNFTSSCWLSGFVLKKGSPEKLRNYLLKHSIESREFWQPIHKQKPYKKNLKTNMTQTNRIWRKIIILPSSTNITKNELNKVFRKIIFYFNK